MLVGTIARKILLFHRTMKKFQATKALVIVLPSRGHDMRLSYEAFLTCRVTEDAAQYALRIGI